MFGTFERRENDFWKLKNLIYSLNAKEWKFTLISEWLSFNSNRVGFSSKRAEKTFSWSLAIPSKSNEFLSIAKVTCIIFHRKQDSIHKISKDEQLLNLCENMFACRKASFCWLQKNWHSPVSSKIFTWVFGVCWKFVYPGLAATPFYQWICLLHSSKKNKILFPMI